jgi:branched-chain amino acid transport system substrate-binding protein
MAKKLLYGLLLTTLLVLPLMTACASTTPTSAPAKTLKVGMVAWFGWPLGLDLKRGVDIMTDLENKAGGINIGGEKYQVQFIEYDSNNDQNTTQAAINKLIFQDKVNFIITDTMYIGSVVPITEENKVICLAGTPVPAIFDKNYKYSFQAGFMNYQTPEMAGWFANSNPQIKTVSCAFPDDQGGHAYGGMVVATLESFGITVSPEFYPPTAVDLSALGTKVKNDNPDAFMAGGGSGTDALAYKAVWQAGYRGQLFSVTTITLATLQSIVPAEGLEGFIGGAWPVEFDPAVTQQAKEFKAAYIAKNGTWDGPEIQLTAVWAALKTALEQAGTMDTDKVADIVGNGLKFEGPTGKGQMVPRDDLGISRTVDSISEFRIKKVVDGKPTLLHTVTLEEGLGYIKK